MKAILTLALAVFATAQSLSAADQSVPTATARLEGVYELDSADKNADAILVIEGTKSGAWHVWGVATWSADEPGALSTASLSFTQAAKSTTISFSPDNKVDPKVELKLTPEGLSATESPAPETGRASFAGAYLRMDDPVSGIKPQHRSILPGDYSRMANRYQDATLKVLANASGGLDVTAIVTSQSSPDDLAPKVDMLEGHAGEHGKFTVFTEGPAGSAGNRRLETFFFDDRLWVRDMSGSRANGGDLTLSGAYAWTPAP